MDEDFLRGNATQGEGMGTPQPVAKQTVCSACGLDWEKHPKNPTFEHCVKLLKEALAVQSDWRPLSPYYQQTGVVTQCR